MKKARMGRPPVKNPRDKINVSLTQEAIQIVKKAQRLLGDESRSNTIDTIIKEWHDAPRKR